jgi:hypothetical protein
MSKRDKVDHHDHEKIVELIRVPTRTEADILIAKLKANAIDTMGEYGDIGGWAPQIGAAQGHAVMVFENDVDRARKLIA